MLSIELDIYSGLQNPTWTLTDKEENELVERVLADPSAMQPTTADAGGLGYRGFIVRAMSEQAESEDSAINKARLRTASGGVVNFPSQFRIGGALDKSVDMAQWLLTTSEKQQTEVDDYLRAYTQQSITNPDRAKPEHKGGESLHQRHEVQGVWRACGSYFMTSSTDFSFWNNAAVIDKNNCYNFGSNYRSNTFAQPGKRATGQWVPTPIQGADVANRVRLDGWKDTCLGGSAQNIVLALVIAPLYTGQNDFHFYRLCANGYWCHKQGPTPARNTDNSGRLITNPETCNRGAYTEFWGYFYANRSQPVI